MPSKSSGPVEMEGRKAETTRRSPARRHHLESIVRANDGGERICWGYPIWYCSIRGTQPTIPHLTAAERMTSECMSELAVKSTHSPKIYEIGNVNLR